MHCFKKGIVLSLHSNGDPQTSVEQTWAAAEVAHQDTPPPQGFEDISGGTIRPQQNEIRLARIRGDSGQP
jgi:hypothetical protein